MESPFRELYTASPISKPVLSQAEMARHITLSCSSMPLIRFVRLFSDSYNVGVVFESSLSDSVVTGEFKDATFDDVFSVVSRQLGVDVVQVGNTYFLGELRPEDRGVLVRKVSGFSDEKLQQICTSLVSASGRSTVQDSIVVITDHRSVLSRLSSSLDYLSSVDYDVFVVQLCFVTLRRDAAADAGLDVRSSGTIAYNVADSKLELNDFNIDALFDFTASSSYADIYSSPMFLMRSGSNAKWQDGKRVPIPKKAVSDYGTVTTTGYDYVNTGFIVDMTVASINGGGRLSLDIELSDVLSYVESAPVTSTTHYSIETDMQSGKLYLLGELSSYKIFDKQSEVLNFSGERAKTVVQLWAQTYLVARDGSTEKPVLP